MISPDLFYPLNLGFVLRIPDRAGEKFLLVLDCVVSVRVKVEARSSFFYILVYLTFN